MDAAATPTNTGTERVPPTITVRPEPGFRGSAWNVRCSDHGQFPGAPRKKILGIRVAMTHRDEEHGGEASVKVRSK